MFVIFGGLPATGKTTLARELARQLRAVYLRIDTIEHAIAPSEGMSVDEAGYRVGYAVAEDNLRLGRTVVADSVNPLRVTRDAWRDVAKRAGAVLVEFWSCAPTRSNTDIVLRRARRILPDWAFRHGRIS